MDNKILYSLHIDYHVGFWPFTKHIYITAIIGLSCQFYFFIKLNTALNTWVKVFFQPYLQKFYQVKKWES